MTNIPIKRLREKAIFPAYATALSAGADLYACPDGPVTIPPHETVMIPLGYAMAKKLFVFTGPEHNHQAQKPEALKL